MPALKPLLVFGLRGTLVERIHIRNVPEGLPAPDLTVGTSRIWLRPHMVEVLQALQEHCNLAIWSSTTARNTHPLVSAVFDSYLPVQSAPAAAATAAASSGFARPSPVAAAPTVAADESASSTANPRTGRFDRKKKAAPAVEASQESVTAPSQPRIRFEFVWTREHTRADDFRRLNAAVVDDNHATVKDLTQIFTQFSSIAQPQNTVLIDDTPSKAKMHADNYLWLDTCEGMNISEENGMQRLLEFVEKELVPAKDVRDVLPRRVRN